MYTITPNHNIWNSRLFLYVQKVTNGCGFRGVRRVYIKQLYWIIWDVELISGYNYRSDRFNGFVKVDKEDVTS